MTTERSPLRRCPRCNSPVAQHADTCLMCGAHLREQKQRDVRVPQGDLLLALLLIAAVVVIWLWKPWEARTSGQAALPSALPSAVLVPTASFVVMPTATPLQTPVPGATATLPPNQTIHTVQAGETLISIAKLYGTTSSVIRRANGLKSNSIIHIGDQLVVPLLTARTPTPTPTTVPSPTPVVYVVQQGDTMSEIARRFGTTVEALMQANGLTGATGLRAGTRLTIVKSPSASASVAYLEYEVKQGDTLYSIASKYKLTVAQLKQYNGLKSDTIQVGQKLKIPSGQGGLLPTFTPSPTSSPTETMTPVPTPPYTAPAPLGPPDGAAFQGPDAGILVNWASVGILREEDWYVVRAWREGPSTEQLPRMWTKVTSWRIPTDLYIAGLSQPQRFYWQVSVMRKTGEAEDGTWIGVELSQRSDVRTFSWQ